MTIAMIYSTRKPEGGYKTIELSPLTVDDSSYLTYRDELYFVDVRGFARKLRVNGYVKKMRGGTITFPVKYGMYDSATVVSVSSGGRSWFEIEDYGLKVYTKD